MEIWRNHWWALARCVENDVCCKWWQRENIKKYCSHFISAQYAKPNGILASGKREAKPVSCLLIQTKASFSYLSWGGIIYPPFILRLHRGKKLWFAEKCYFSTREPRVFSKVGQTLWTSFQMNYKIPVWASKGGMKPNLVLSSLEEDGYRLMSDHLSYI